MLTLVISSPDKFNSEIEHVTELLDAGLPVFHVRKPKFSVRKMKAYLSLIPSKYHDRIVIHSHHELAIKFDLRGIHLTEKHRKSKLGLWWKLKRLRMKKSNLTVTASFHELSQLASEKVQFDYVFLSPVFNSISKKHKQPKFSLEQIKDAIKRTKHKVVALGGVGLDRMDAVYEIGFQGVAMLGEVWNNGELSPTDAYKQVREYQHKAIRQVKISSLRIAQ